LHCAGGRVPHAFCSAGKASPDTCHRAASAPRRTHCLVGRLMPRAWNRAAQGPHRASFSVARPVPRASSCATRPVPCTSGRIA
ncbi:hypothetical protein HAX54_035477, partial [Datura stramonium]|nr:hypothetical protein [Datura stramonium]